MPDPVTKNEIAATIDMARLIAREDPAEAARQLAYIPPAEAIKARKDLGLQNHMAAEMQERAAIKAREAEPLQVRIGKLPTLKPEVAQPGTTPLAWWGSWEEAIERAKERGETDYAAKLREMAIAEAVDAINKGYGSRFVWIQTELGGRMYPELYARFSPEIVTVAMARADKEKARTWGPERIARMSALLAYKVDAAARLPEVAPWPHAWRPTQQEERESTLAAQTVVWSRQAAPFMVLDANNLNTALTYGYRLEEWDKVMRWQQVSITVAQLASTLALFGVSKLITSGLRLAWAAPGARMLTGAAPAWMELLANLAAWRAVSLQHRIMGRLVPIPHGAEKPYAKLVEALKDFLFSVPSIPGLAVWGLIIADYLGYLEVPMPEAPAPEPAPLTDEESDLYLRYVDYSPRQLAQLPAGLVERIYHIRQKAEALMPPSLRTTPVRQP